MLGKSQSILPRCSQSLSITNYCRVQQYTVAGQVSRPVPQWSSVVCMFLSQVPLYQLPPFTTPRLAVSTSAACMHSKTAVSIHSILRNCLEARADFSLSQALPSALRRDSFCPAASCRSLRRCLPRDSQLYIAIIMRKNPPTKGPSCKRSSQYIL